MTSELYPAELRAPPTESALRPDSRRRRGAAQTPGFLHLRPFLASRKHAREGHKEEK